MKYCIQCGSRNPIDAVYCMNCRYEFPKETLEADTRRDYPSQTSQLTNPPISPYGQPLTYVQPVHAKYGNIIDHSKYQHFINGSLALTIGPVISFFLGIIFYTDESGLITFLSSLIDFSCFALFTFGIYSIAQLEPRTLNDQLRNVPKYLALFTVLNFISGFLFNIMPTITTDMSIEEASSIVFQGMTITLMLTGSAFVFLIGANTFTKWFEQFVVVLGAPYNAPTIRIKWLAVCHLIGSALLTLAFLMILIALESLSVSMFGTITIVITLGTIILLAAVLLQIFGGYKIYSVLTNIRKGKYDGTYQQQVSTEFMRR
ncbi:MAG: hypothetical protein ACFE9L_06670 [Candidatus Hodarchaeota archaeon]